MGAGHPDFPYWPCSGCQTLPPWTTWAIEQFNLVVGLPCFAHTVENNFRKLRISANARGVPNQLSLFLRGISPSMLASLQPLSDDAFRLSKQNRNIFLRVQAVADKKGDHNHISRLGQFIAMSDARLFFQVHCMDGCIEIPLANQRYLPLNGHAGVLVLFGAVAGNKQCRLLSLRRPSAR